MAKYHSFNVVSHILGCAAVFCDYLWFVQEEVMPLTLEDSDDDEEEENSSNEEQEETDMESDLEGKRDDGKSLLFIS